MSQRFDSTDYITRTANLPSNTAFTVGGWIYINSLPASSLNVFSLNDGSGNTLARIYWSTSVSKFRIANDTAGASDFSSSPTSGGWYYLFVRSNGTTMSGGWKDIDDAAFVDSSGITAATFAYSNIRAGTDLVLGTLDMNLFRLSVWDEHVTNANLLLAAATDKGYTTNLNTHLPLTNGIGSPWADTSGNARDWTNVGSFSDQADPTLGGGGGVPKSTRLTMLGVG